MAVQLSVTVRNARLDANRIHRLHLGDPEAPLGRGSGQLRRGRQRNGAGDPEPAVRLARGGFVAEVAEPPSCATLRVDAVVVDFPEWPDEE